MLVRWHSDGPDSQAFKDHVRRIPDYLWYVFVDESITTLSLVHERMIDVTTI